jgi:ubiquinone/menaquinone biosynthesis C-methylase UbiE
MAFPSPTALADRLRKIGFSNVEFEPLTFGIAHLHVATK